MSTKTAKAVILYGLFLILAGVVGFLSNPEKAKTALMSGGTFGTLAIIWGWLGLRKVAWSLLAAKISVIFLTVVFSWRAAVTWGKVFAGASEKMFAAGLISSMLVASAILLVVLIKNKSPE